MANYVACVIQVTTVTNIVYVIKTTIKTEKYICILFLFWNYSGMKLLSAFYYCETVDLYKTLSIEILPPYTFLPFSGVIWESLSSGFEN